MASFGNSLQFLGGPQNALENYFPAEVKENRSLWIYPLNWMDVS